MASLIPNDAEVNLIEAIVNKTSNSDLVLRLYTNNYTPLETDTVSNYTEASGNGYAAITLTGSSWSIAEGNPATATFAQQTFTFTGALGNVYGYYVTRGDGELMWAEKFSSVVDIQNNGDEIKITLQFTLKEPTE